MRKARGLILAAAILFGWAVAPTGESKAAPSQSIQSALTADAVVASQGRQMSLASTCETSETETSESSLTCCAGYWWCPDDGAEFWYEAVGCGWPNAVTARNQCNSYCGSSCQNSGWIC